MKKIFLLLASIFAMNTFSAFATNNEVTVATQSESNFYTCKFSLNHYTGCTNDYGNSGSFWVKLNCPQQQDVYATVYIYIGGKRIASKVVKIKAGYTESSADYFSLPQIYGNKDYTLKVE